MARRPERRRGRPPAPTPKDIQLNFRIDSRLREALEAHQRKHELDSISSAARDALRKVLRSERLY